MGLVLPMGVPADFGIDGGNDEAGNGDAGGLGSVRIRIIRIWDGLQVVGVWEGVLTRG